MLDEELVALARQLQERCLELGLTVATAESCTGGLVAAAITAVPGSSGYFRAGLVTYSDDAKRDFLDVPDATLTAHGAVSAQTARAMATGARARIHATMAVSITGVAGPDGGSAEKPVGLTYVGLAAGDDVEVRKLQLTGDRQENRTEAARVALEWLAERAGQAGELTPR